MFAKILIANRGEIAVRIIRACRDMGIKTVAVYSTADINSLHVRMADESVCIGDGPSKSSYLKMHSIIAAAEVTAADAIHPGVGFLSENADFAAMVEAHGINFIGPSAEHIKIMGDKISAKNAMRELGVPLVPGSQGKITSSQELTDCAKELGFPVLIKALCGGGGKGMQVVYTAADLEPAFKLAQMEAKSSFGDESVFMEHYLQKPRHIEVQILADKYGNVVHLGERDCSVQRNHQKIWEEAPCPILTIKEREEIGAVCTKAIQHMGYCGLGTLEFLFENNQFNFIEMNTRIQVEHPITEMITRLDLVKEQIKVAAGEKLSITQSDVVLKGHAIECRINAEHPETFLPSPGTVTFYHAPGGPNVRVDSHLYHGYTVPSFYDSLVSKLIVHGANRSEALSTLARVLDEYIIDGIHTLIPLHKNLVRNTHIITGQYNIHWLKGYIHEHTQQTAS